MAKQPKRIVAGNWKMNGDKELVRQFNAHLFSVDGVDTVLCPPSVYLVLAEAGENHALGAQDCSAFESGAHTGDISVNMLKELGCKYVIVGHSERRQDHGESNELVAAKVKAVIDVGLTPILCVGEPLDVRESGGVFGYVAAQLNAVIDVCGEDVLTKTVIAYEPIWAIGTGKTASPEQAQEVHKFIRDELLKVSDAADNTSILYGGSVKPENAQALFSQPDINGGLIGGASLQIDSFNKICQAAG